MGSEEMSATSKSLHGEQRVSIHVAAPGDRDAILKVVRDAFSREGRNGQEEVDIVVNTWRLQATLSGLELLAVEGNSVVGYVVGARGDLGGRQVVAVAPLAVSTSTKNAGRAARS
jgi:predicted N-acetyltransferase YhbS